jgi:hypothetical protein
VAWCNVFGSRKEELHWTKTPTCDTSSTGQPELSSWLYLQPALLNNNQDHREEMQAFRISMAHFDLANRFTDPVPYFDPALQVASIRSG